MLNKCENGLDSGSTLLNTPSLPIIFGVHRSAIQVKKESHVFAKQTSISKSILVVEILNCYVGFTPCLPHTVCTIAKEDMAMVAMILENEPKPKLN